VEEFEKAGFRVVEMTKTDVKPVGKRALCGQKEILTFSCWLSWIG
jgi:hypothetical protein